MDPRNRNTHLKLLGISSPSFFKYLGNFLGILVGIKRVHSYPFLVSFFQIGELSLSLGVLGPTIQRRSCYHLHLVYLGKVTMDLGG